MTARYAIYYAPRPETELARRGARWLGRDAWTDAELEQPSVRDISPERFHELTASPRHYGLHATLKAPFELATDAAEAELIAALERFAAPRRAFDLDLELGALGGFLCLLEARPSPLLQALADDCVRELEPFRAPLGEADLARRIAAGLGPAELERSRRWGYHHVLEHFRFHVTLSERLQEPDLACLHPAAEALLGALSNEPVAIEGICLFYQPQRDRPFVVRSHHALAAAT